jgi:hypothetical protein
VLHCPHDDLPTPPSPETRLSHRLPFSSRKGRGGRGGRGVRLAAPSRLPAMSLAALSGGGILPRSRCQCQTSAPVSRLPAVRLGAHVANWRGTPVFPPTHSAEVSPSVPSRTPLLQRPASCLWGCRQRDKEKKGLGDEVPCDRRKSLILTDKTIDFLGGLQALKTRYSVSIRRVQPRLNLVSDE